MAGDIANTMEEARFVKQTRNFDIQRVIVKIGSSLLTNNGRGLDRTAIYEWAKQIAKLHKKGVEVLLVSSGAVAEGVVRMNLEERPKKLAALQACASIGQMGLIETWWSALIQHGIQSSQLLLTHDDLSNRSRYLNTTGALTQLLEWRVLPVINENDTITIDEIKFGDNDTLGAMAAAMVNADLYIILTDQEGVFTDNPRDNPDAKMIRQERAMADYLFDIAGDGGKLGRGGMLTKIRAGRLAAMGGCPTVIVSGAIDDVITRVVSGEAVGTLLTTNDEDKIIARKQWLAAHLRMSGSLVVDAGAARALTEHNRSLLPVGVVEVQGGFDEGDVVEIIHQDTGERIAVGQVNFSSNDARRVARERTEQFDKIFGSSEERVVMVHRDNLALTV
ncbi:MULTISPECIES: glutamate 5-kinase [Psychrobacter]|uniref:glutamate 5-kinase n=1 Tax=Psychrobacter TaxID=497 RepID=UPI00086C74FB|nr:MULTISPECIES: glutamate 5-kinase [Psychrobacter]MBA6243867.1 glutamate 5-kinase [Psychrobacter sp. Urea-trap-18]MBA6285450.1 glutamate 5-kinase [Psychrobacter sp. Urea-trap-16]MBA6319030.1 glutamate 5-kinase [Psychrobacter sp. Urea-trap-20]MBA6335049.1 glutamate 5-kinase [Psychrobacter sp. Urea-trap-19]OEH69251.1 MAG: glutamate 5-kinase [Psychrobacter sp. B29-1]|tara:strand:+ start:9673 stop:10845 length:1173 start_codon:yes stop_codon:yes gene_type:complete